MRVHQLISGRLLLCKKPNSGLICRYAKKNRVFQEYIDPEKVKEGFRKRGETIKSWCDARGYDPTYVSRILNGTIKANYGKAHEIAVELGMKPKSEEMQRSA